MQPVLGGSGDPRLASAVELVRRLVDALVDSLPVRPLPVGESADTRGPGRDRARTGDSEETPAGERALGGFLGWAGFGHRVMAPVIFESGSARVFTASESSLRWASVTLS